MNEVVIPTLSPVIQACKILQSRKTHDDDVARICDLAGEHLSIQQVMKLLNQYSARAGIEADKVSKLVNERVKTRLQSTRHVDGDAMQKSKLLMDNQFASAVRFPFNPGTMQLKLINSPDTFGLAQLVMNFA